MALKKKKRKAEKIAKIFKSLLDHAFMLEYKIFGKNLRSPYVTPGIK